MAIFEIFGLTAYWDDTAGDPFINTSLFMGKVTSINLDAPGDKIVRIKYDDGEVEDSTVEEVDAFHEAASIPVGQPGFLFIKKFGQAGWFSGKVIKILDSGKRMCEYEEDGERQDYKLDELQSFSTNKVVESVADAGGDSDSDYEAGEGENEDGEGEDEMNEEEFDGNVDSEDDVQSEKAPSDNNSIPKVISKKKQKSSKKNYVRMLVTIPVGTTLADHLQSLKERPTAREGFKSNMSYPKRILEDRYSKLTLDGRPVTVLPYATEADCKIITDALVRYESAYRPEYRSKSQLGKMPNFKEFFGCPRHCRITLYSIEMRLCGVVGCTICLKIGRTVRTPNVIVDGLNLREEALRFMTMPVENKDDKEHFLSPEKARLETETNNLSTEDLIDFIPKAKTDSKEKKAVNAGKKADKSFNFHTTQVRMTVRCNSCNAIRIVCSKNVVGGKNGPSEDDLEKLEEKLESSGYRCGMDINSGKLYARQAVLCGHPIEAEYYNPKTGTKGGRIVTTDICAICYIDDDLVAPNEISKAKKVGGKTPLTMCRGCFDSDVEPPCSGKRTNTKQATQQKNSANKRKMDNAVKSGRRKARKGS